MQPYDTIIRMIEGEFVTFASARRYAMNLGFTVSDDGRHASGNDETGEFVLVVDDDDIAHWVRKF